MTINARYVALLLLSITALFACNQDQAGTMTKKLDQYTAAEYLAIIDSNPGREAEYDQLLDSLISKCSMSRIDVSDTADKGTQLLKEKRGVSMSALDFLIAWDEIISSDTQSIKCTRIAATLIFLTESQ